MLCCICASLKPSPRRKDVSASAASSSPWSSGSSDSSTSSSAARVWLRASRTSPHAITAQARSRSMHACSDGVVPGLCKGVGQKLRSNRWTVLPIADRRELPQRIGACRPRRHARSKALEQLPRTTEVARSHLVRRCRRFPPVSRVAGPERRQRCRLFREVGGDARRSAPCRGRCRLVERCGDRLVGTVGGE